MRYVVDTVECSGGLDGKPEHKTLNLTLGSVDIFLVCPTCRTLYASKERMGSRHVQGRIALAKTQLEKNLRPHPDEKENILKRFCSTIKKYISF